MAFARGASLKLHAKLQASQEGCVKNSRELVPESTLRSEIITQLIPQKIFRAMITRISRNPARNNSSEIFWRNDKMAIAQIYFWKHATKTIINKKAESNNKIAQSTRKQFPKSYFAQSIATISRNPSENNFSIIFSRAHCFLNGG